MGANVWFATVQQGIRSSGFNGFPFPTPLITQAEKDSKHFVEVPYAWAVALYWRVKRFNVTAFSGSISISYTDLTDAGVEWPANSLSGDVNLSGEPTIPNPDTVKTPDTVTELSKILGLYAYGYGRYASGVAPPADIDPSIPAYTYPESDGLEVSNMQMGSAEGYVMAKILASATHNWGEMAVRAHDDPNKLWVRFPYEARGYKEMSAGSCMPQVTSGFNMWYGLGRYDLRSNVLLCEEVPDDVPWTTTPTEFGNETPPRLVWEGRSKSYNDAGLFTIQIPGFDDISFKIVGCMDSFYGTWWSGNEPADPELNGTVTLNATYTAELYWPYANQAGNAPIWDTTTGEMINNPLS